MEKANSVRLHVSAERPVHSVNPIQVYLVGYATCLLIIGLPYTREPSHYTCIMAGNVFLMYITLLHVVFPPLVQGSRPTKVPVCMCPLLYCPHGRRGTAVTLQGVLLLELTIPVTLPAWLNLWQLQRRSLGTEWA